MKKSKGIYKKRRGNKTEWGERIYTKTDRRPHGDGRGLTEGVCTGEYTHISRLDCNSQCGLYSIK